MLLRVRLGHVQHFVAVEVEQPLGRHVTDLFPRHSESSEASLKGGLKIQNQSRVDRRNR